MKYKKVFTKWMALELRKRGYSIVKTEPNYTAPQHNVYTFALEGNLLADMYEIAQERKNRKQR